MGITSGIYFPNLIHMPGKQDKKIKLIVILGPTASGKSNLAVALAKQFNGEVISADSRQIYKWLNLGTGKITKKEMKGVPHHLLDITCPRHHFSAARFQKIANLAIRQIAQKGKLPFLAGGSAFYIYAVADGWQFPKTKIDQKLRRELSKKTVAELFVLLQQIDPRRAQTIEKHNPRRIIRAIEIAKQLGSVPPRINIPNFTCLFLGIKKTDKELKFLIKKRLQTRLALGMTNEVRRLLKNKKLTLKRCQELGLEYKWISKYITKEISYEEMFLRLNADIWRFSRHQMNWFNKDKRISWVKNEMQAKRLIKKFVK